MTTDKIKRKLTAILSADVKGYSRLMGEDEEWTLRTLNRALRQDAALQAGAGRSARRRVAQGGAEVKEIP